MPVAHKNSAHYFRAMKNITLSADEHIIQRARDEARARQTTLNALFREWLNELAGGQERRERVAKVLARMAEFDSAGPFTRDELNER